MSERALAYWVIAPGEGEVREASFSASDSDASGEAAHRYRALYTGVSPGTERLVGLGRVPRSCAEPMACRHMEGDFDLPVKYGYSWIGVGEEGPYRDRRVFVMHPHQDMILVEDDQVLALPDSIPSQRATLIPNLETALNAVWDSGLVEEPKGNAGGAPSENEASGEKAIVFGGGVVGLLIGFVLSALGRRVTLVETWNRRLELAASCSWIDRAIDASAVPKQESSIAFHTTGTEQGLQLALDSLSFEGTVVELSWYGDRPVRLSLGGDFHYLRKRIVASQVGSIASSMRSKIDHRGRLRRVLELLEDTALDILLGEPIGFAEMPRFMTELYEMRVPEPSPVIHYS